jgi:hypothetical protein
MATTTVRHHLRRTTKGYTGVRRHHRGIGDARRETIMMERADLETVKKDLTKDVKKEDVELHRSRIPLLLRMAGFKPGTKEYDQAQKDYREDFNKGRELARNIHRRGGQLPLWAQKLYKIDPPGPLTSEERRELPRSAFAIPKERKYPIENVAHGRNALARVAAYGTPEEKRVVRRAVHKKFPSIGKT